MTAMRTLIQAVEAGALPSLRDRADTLGTDQDDRALWFAHAFDGSVDAALALMEVVLPGCAWSLYDNADGDFQAGVHRHDDEHDFHICEFSDTPGRALLLAILKAMEATNAGKE